MRILHLVDRLTGRGGAYTHLMAVAAAQVDAGHDVLVAGGLVAHRAAWPCAVRTVRGLEARARASVALDALHRERAPQVVHVHTVVNPWVLEWAAERRAVITVQDHRYFCPSRGKWTLDGRACHETLAHSTCAACFEDAGYFEEVWGLTRERLDALRGLTVVVLSRYMGAELVAAGLDPARVHVVPPFVHGLRPAPKPEASCVLFVGRLSEAKGVRDAVDAWRRAASGLPLVVAGTGPLREWATTAGAEVLGWVPHDRLGALYGRAAALVMPPRWQEPFGIAGLEALTLGVPVAAWDCGGIPEWHPGGASLVRWGDVDALAEAIRWCAGRRAAPPEGFGREPLMRRLDAVYEAARSAG